jgi:putative tryptophan/tyrosine transport system substrate-binding protein
MHRREFIPLIGATLLAAGTHAWPQPAPAVRRIGVLMAASAPDPPWPGPLLDGLRDLGWIEGRNLVIERRTAADRVERLPALAAELVVAKAEVIVTGGTPAALAARGATSTIPIVLWSIFDPVRAGLVESLARPGGNVTGNTLIEPDLGAKRLQVLKEMLPEATRIGEFGNSTNPAMSMLRQGEEDALQRLGLQSIFVDVTDALALDAAFAALVRERAQALVIHSDTLFLSNRERIMALALKHALPTMAEGRPFAQAGALVSYAPSTDAMMRNAAVFVDKILRGAKPADLPVERPTKIELVINRKTARLLGVAIPRSLLLRADEVIE